MKEMIGINFVKKILGFFYERKTSSNCNEEISDLPFVSENEENKIVDESEFYEENKRDIEERRIISENSALIDLLPESDTLITKKKAYEVLRICKGLQGHFYGWGDGGFEYICEYKKNFEPKELLPERIVRERCPYETTRIIKKYRVGKNRMLILRKNHYNFEI